jgi:DNA-binding LytR/AlgR family response regulator
MIPFFVWQDRVLMKVDPKEVLCLETIGNYTRIYLSDNTFYMVRSTLSGALKKLSPDIFIKTHRAYAVSILHIDNIARDHVIVLDQSVPIAKRYYPSVIRKLNIIE